MIENLHAGLGWLTAGGLISLSFVTSFITAAFGIGGGGALLAALASLLPIGAVIPVHGVVQLGSNTGRAIIMREHTNWRALGPFLIGCAIGVAAGGFVAVDLPAHLFEILVGLFVLWSVFFKPPGFLAASAISAGAFSSFLTMFVGGTGPFVAGYVKTMGLDRMRHVATHASLMTLQHLLKTIAFGLLGFAFSEWMPLIAAMIASGFLGTLVGKRVLMKIPEHLFKTILSGILIVLALRLVWSGASVWL